MTTYDEEIQEENKMIDYVECFYICCECGASYSDGEVDCYECDGQRCCYLYQAETYEEAKLMAEKDMKKQKVKK